MKSASLPNLLGRRQDLVGDEIENHFACGLSVTTEVLHKRDARRILPLGWSTCSLLNRMANHPEMVRGKRVFEPFAGSGPLGLMALAQGAEHVDFLDINPRAVEYQLRNAAASGFEPTRFSARVGDVAKHTPSEPYHVVLANPPFVPTPDGIAGTLTSNGGADGNRSIAALLERFDVLLRPDGEAWVLMWQIVKEGRPLIADRVVERLPGRPAVFHKGQLEAIPLEASSWAYRRLFPHREAEVAAWEAALVAAHGTGLQECQYVMQLGPESPGGGSCAVRDDFAEQFGEDFMIPAGPAEELAFGRAFENFIPPD